MSGDLIEVIASTISGSISDWKKVDRIVPLFAEHGVPEARLHVADSHARAREIARQSASAGSRTLISAGGSGTFNGVLEGCIDSGVDLSSIRLGFLRKGSADLIGKVLGMPDEIDAAVRVFVEALREGRVVPCDIIQATTEGDSPPRHFVGYGGTEIFGRIPHYTENRLMKYYKGVLGQLLGDLGPFFAGALLSAVERSVRRLAGPARRWRITVDGREAPGGPLQAMILVNGDLGPDLPLARSAPLGSGRFHLFTIRDLGLTRLPGQFRRAWNASILEEPRRWGFESWDVTRSLRIEPASDLPFPVNVDGSTMICRRAATFRIVDRIHLLSGHSRAPATSSD
jgi:diacylglycerol kinase family enzyme